MKCIDCGSEMTYFGTMTTLVGYVSPPGHNHDDNCRTREYKCYNGHSILVSVRNVCPNATCDWKGKESCRTCQTILYDKWPE